MFSFLWCFREKTVSGETTSVKFFHFSTHTNPVIACFTNILETIKSPSFFTLPTGFCYFLSLWKKGKNTPFFFFCKGKSFTTLTYSSYGIGFPAYETIFVIDVSWFHFFIFVWSFLKRGMFCVSFWQISLKWNRV